MSNDINSFKDAFQQAAAHELGHSFYAMLGGMAYAQIDFQIKKLSEPWPIELYARATHGTFEEKVNLASGGLAGVIAQELFLRPEMTDFELFERALKSKSLSETDLARFKSLTPEELKVAFADAGRVIRPILPRLNHEVAVLFNNFKARFEVGATSAGYRYFKQGQQLAMQEVPILKDLFEPEPKGDDVG